MTNNGTTIFFSCLKKSQTTDFLACDLNLRYVINILFHRFDHFFYFSAIKKLLEDYFHDEITTRNAKKKTDIPQGNFQLQDSLVFLSSLSLFSRADL